MSLQVDGNVAFEHPVSYAVQPPMILPFYVFVLVISIEAVVLPSTCSLKQFLSTSFTLSGVLSTTINVVFQIFIFSTICLLSPGSSCSMCCNYCGVPEHTKNVISKAENLAKLSVYLHAIALPVSVGEMVYYSYLDPDVLTIFV